MKIYFTGLLILFLIAVPSTGAEKQRVDATILVLSTTWDVGFAGFEGYGYGDNFKPMLEAFGAKFVQIKVLDEEGYPLNDDIELEYIDADGVPHGKYMGILLQDDRLQYVHPDSGDYLSALPTAMWNRIEAYERQYGVREVIAFSEAELPCWKILGYREKQETFHFTTPLSAQTEALIQGLRPTLEVTNGIDAFRIRITITDPSQCESLVQLKSSNTVKETIMAIEKREATSGQDANRLHVFTGMSSFESTPMSRVLGSVWFHFLTRQQYLGSRRVRLATHIDDVFLPTSMFDPSIGAIGTSSYREDLHDLEVLKQNQDSINAALPGSTWRAEFAFNGLGVWVNGGPESDDFFNQCRDVLHHFYWLTHTFTHTLLDDITYEQVLWEIDQNNYLAIDLFNLTDEHSPLSPYWSKESIVTPGISGIFTGHSLQALSDRGIHYAVGTDTDAYFPQTSSYHGTYATLERNGFDNFFYIPRFSSRVAFDTSLPSELLGAVNMRTAETFASLEDIMAAEAQFAATMLLGYRHDPYMFHQANLRAFPWDLDRNPLTPDQETSLVGLWTQRVLDYYQQYSNLPFLTEQMDKTARLFQERMARDECVDEAYYEVDFEPIAAGGPVTVTGKSLKVTTKSACRLGITGVDGNLMTVPQSNLEIEEYGPDTTLWVQMPDTPAQATIPLHSSYSGVFSPADTKIMVSSSIPSPLQIVDVSVYPVDQNGFSFPLNDNVFMKVTYSVGSGTPGLIVDAPMTVAPDPSVRRHFSLAFTTPAECTNLLLTIYMVTPEGQTQVLGTKKIIPVRDSFDLVEECTPIITDNTVLLLVDGPASASAFSADGVFAQRLRSLGYRLEALDMQVAGSIDKTTALLTVAVEGEGELRRGPISAVWSALTATALQERYPAFASAATEYQAMAGLSLTSLPDTVPTFSATDAETLPSAILKTLLGLYAEVSAPGDALLATTHVLIHRCVLSPMPLAVSLTAATGVTAKIHGVLSAGQFETLTTPEPMPTLVAAYAPGEDVFECSKNVPVSTSLSEVKGLESGVWKSGVLVPFTVILRSQLGSLYSHTIAAELRAELVCSNKPVILSLSPLVSPDTATTSNALFTSSLLADRDGQCELRLSYTNNPIAGSPIPLLFTAPDLDYQTCESTRLRHRALLISPQGLQSDYQFQSAKAMFDTMGVPYDVMVATAASVETVLPLDVAPLDGEYPYDAIVLSTSGLSYLDPGSGLWKSAFTQKEWYHVQLYQMATSAHRLSFITYPSATLGVVFKDMTNMYTSTPLPLNFTPEAYELFPGLDSFPSTVSTGGAFMYLSRVMDPLITVPLAKVTLEDGSEAVVLVLHHFNDGRVEVFSMLDVSAFSPHYPQFSLIFSTFVQRWQSFAGTQAQTLNSSSPLPCGPCESTLHLCDGFSIYRSASCGEEQGCALEFEDLLLDLTASAVSYPGLPAVFPLPNVQQPGFPPASLVLMGTGTEGVFEQCGGVNDEEVVFTASLFQTIQDEFGITKMLSFELQSSLGLPPPTLSQLEILVWKDSVPYSGPIAAVELKPLGYSVKFTPTEAGSYTVSFKYTAAGETEGVLVENLSQTAVYSMVVSDLSKCSGQTCPLGSPQAVGANILVLSATGLGSEPQTQQFVAYLEAKGIPYLLHQTVVDGAVNPELPLLYAGAEGNVPNILAVVLATDTLAAQIDGDWVSTISENLRTELNTYTETYGVRVLSLVTYPTAAIGMALSATHPAGGYDFEVSLDTDLSANLLPPSKAGAFSLRTHGAWMYPATILDTSMASPFLHLSDPSTGDEFIGGAVVKPTASSPETLHVLFYTASWFPNIDAFDELLVNWVTGGVYVGSTDCSVADNFRFTFCDVLRADTLKLAEFSSTVPCTGILYDSRPSVFKVELFSLPPTFTLALDGSGDGSGSGSGGSTLRADMKLLLVTPNGNTNQDILLLLLRQHLAQNNIPYDEYVVTAHPGEFPTLEDTAADKALYNGLIFTSQKLGYESAGVYKEALTPALEQHFQKFELTYGVRRVSLFSVDYSDHGVKGVEPASGQIRTFTLSEEAKQHLTAPTEAIIEGRILSNNWAWNIPVTIVAPETASLVFPLKDENWNGIAYTTTLSDGRRQMHLTSLFATWMYEADLVAEMVVGWASGGVYLQTGESCPLAATMEYVDTVCAGCWTQLLIAGEPTCTATLQYLNASPETRTVTGGETVAPA